MKLFETDFLKSSFLVGVKVKVSSDEFVRYSY